MTEVEQIKLLCTQQRLKYGTIKYSIIGHAALSILQAFPTFPDGTWNACDWHFAFDVARELIEMESPAKGA